MPFQFHFECRLFTEQNITFIPEVNLEIFLRIKREKAKLSKPGLLLHLSTMHRETIHAKRRSPGGNPIRVPPPFY